MGQGLSENGAEPMLPTQPPCFGCLCLWINGSYGGNPFFSCLDPFRCPSSGFILPSGVFYVTSLLGDLRKRIFSSDSPSCRSRILRDLKIGERTGRRKSH